MADTFSLDLSRLIAKANGNVELVTRKVMLDMFKSCISKSPVRTGRFRGAWVVGIGAPAVAPADRVDRRKVGARSGKVIDAMAKEVNTMRIYDDVAVFLTNAMPYAQKLEYGYSKQSPAGMVRTTLTEVVSKYGV